MNQTEYKKYKTKLDTLFKEIGSMSYESELQAHWARYLCVLVSGFLEVAVRDIYSEHCRKSSSPIVSNYAVSKIKKFNNPKMTKIIEITKEFSPEWGDLLDQSTQGKLKDSVDSIVANRHLIAHGKDVGITYHRVHDYYKNVLKVIELLSKQCSS